MKIMQTRNRAVVWGVLLSAFIVGVVLTLGQVPLAVSQPVAKRQFGAMRGRCQPIFRCLSGLPMRLAY